MKKECITIHNIKSYNVFIKLLIRKNEKETFTNLTNQLLCEFFGTLKITFELKHSKRFNEMTPFIIPNENMDLNLHT